MANRYWVGGTASWDGTAGTKWSATDGGAGGATVPTSADDVFFTASSGVGTVTIASGNTGAKTINCTGFTGILAGSAAITVSGSVTLVAGMTVTYSGTLTLNATATLTTAGKTIGPLTINGSGITVTLGDALTCSNAITITQGTFTTANYNVTATIVSSTNTNIRAINLGSSTVTLNGGGLGVQNSTNMTFNAGTSTIVLSNTSVNFNFGLTAGPGGTFYNVSFTSTSVLTYSVGGPNTFNNLTVTAPSSAGVTQVTFGSPQTINGTLSTTGTAGNRRVWFRGVTYGLAQTLTVNATPSLTDADFRDIYVIGTAAPISGTRIGDLRGCSGITFSTPKNCYRVGAGDWTDNQWSDTSGGSVSTDNFPLAQDTAIINQSSTSPITLNTVITYTGAVDFSARTSAFVFNTGNSFTFYGSLTLGSGVTTNGTNTQTFSGRNTQVITSAGKTFTFPITVDSYGGTVELADALNIGSNTLTVTNGTFDTKNYNVTAGSLSSNNSNVRTITLGSSTVTTDGNTACQFGIATNLTFNAGTSTISTTNALGSISAANSAGNPLTFYNFNFNRVGSPTIQYTIQGFATFNNITVTAPSTVGYAELIISGTFTVNGTLTVAGATPVRRVFVRSDTLGTTRTLTVGTLSATDCDFRDITIAGAAAGSSPTRAGDCGGNSGITFPAPKTVYWNLAGTQNWSATAWAPGSGGTPDINNFPLAQDTAVFDNTGSAGTVTIDQAWNIGTFDASLRTSAMTLTVSSNNAFIYKDWKAGSGLTHTDQQNVYFTGRGTQTITSNGITFGGSLRIEFGNIELADALVLNSSRLLSLNAGSFDAKTYNVTTGLFTTDSTVLRTLRMGSGTWTLSGTGNVWNATTTTNLTFYKGTANITLSNTSTTARTFIGGNLSYNKLTIGGTTGTSTLTITGDNQFTELASTKTVAHTISMSTGTQRIGKWSISGTAGNVVTFSGTGGGHIITGSCVSGVDYLAMGTVSFSDTSPGEFYAGANSTGVGAGVILTAAPTPRTLYWVGGTGNWNDTARWSTSSGGGSGAAIPTSLDDVVFDAASNATAYTSTVNATSRCNKLTIAGPASGNVTLAGSSALIIHDDVTLPATGMTRTYTGTITLSGSTTGKVLTTNGIVFVSPFVTNGVSSEWSLGSAAECTTFSIVNGSFDLAGYNLTCQQIASDNGNSRTINFGSGTITATLGLTTFGTTETSAANLTVTAGTSQINFSSASPTFSGNGKTFYNVAFTSTSAGTVTINGANSFNNLSFTGITSAGLKNISITANQTVTGTLTCSAGTDATMRHFVRSDTLGTTRTLTCAAVSLTDVDFRDITIAGAAAPATGTRIGDCKGNSGITFTAAANKYWNLAAGGNWGGAIGWATSSGGTPAINNFPLAQDTCFFEATGLTSGSTITINQNYNIGAIDMSARTANTMTLTINQLPFIHGNWINGTGTTLTGTGQINFAGRNSQTITSAGRTFTQNIYVNSPSGSVTLQDAFETNRSASTALLILAGTFDANTYNVTVSGAIGAVDGGSSTLVRTIAVGSGTWTIAGSSAAWSANTTNFTVTGTGTISLTSASAKTFAGGGVSYSGITLNQGGAGTLTVTGNNTFKTISNTYSATGATTINFGTTTTRITNPWTASGAATRILTIQGTSASSPCTLIYTGAGQAANVDYLTITGVRAYPL